MENSIWPVQCMFWFSKTQIVAKIHNIKCLDAVILQSGIQISCRTIQFLVAMFLKEVALLL